MSEATIEAPTTTTPSSTPSDSVVITPAASANLADVLPSTPVGSTSPLADNYHKDAPSFDDFQAIIDGRTPEVKTAPVAPTTPAAEPPKPVTNQVVPPVQPVAPAKPADGLQPIKVDLGAAHAARDYTGLNEEESRIFKSMSNEAYNKLAPIYRERQTQSAKLAELQAKLEAAPKNASGIPDNYQEHEDAYVLTPEYKQLATQTQKLNIESTYWTQQLEILKSGKKPNALATDVNGNYVQGQQLEPTAATEALIIKNINLTSQWQTNAEQKIQQLAANHSNNYKQANTGLRQAEAQFFPFFEQPGHAYEGTLKQVIAALPRPYQGHPLAPLVAKSYATILELQKQLSEAKLSSGTPNGGAPLTDAQKAGPTNTATTNTAVVGIKEAPTFDDDIKAFEALLGKKF